MSLSSVILLSSFAYDPDAQAFFTASGLANVSQKHAINDFVISLKLGTAPNRLWDRMRALYPFVGGTAAIHKFNLKSPVDADVNFRLTFGANITHGVSGVNFANPGSGAADNCRTFFVPSAVYPSYAMSGGVRLKTIPNANNASGDYFGGFGAAGVNGFFMRRNTSATEHLGGIANGTRINAAVTLLELWSMNITGQSATGGQVYKNGVAAGAPISTATNALTPVEMYLGHTNSNGTIIGISTMIMEFAFMADSMSAAEHLALTNAVATLQTALGR